MKPRSTLTERWQTTIPAAIRKALRLQPRQHLTYELREGGVFVRPENDGLGELYGRLDGRAPAAPKVEERRSARSARLNRYLPHGRK